MWLIVAVISYLINSGVYVADKFLLSKKIHSSISYAFFVGVWSVFNFIILPFDFWIPNLRELGMDLLAGLLFLVTLIFWYKALHQSEATRVVPIVGALVPIFSFLLSFIFLGEVLTERELLAFLILTGGGILISVKRTKFYLLRQVVERMRVIFGDVLGGIHAEYRPTQRLIINSVASALFFASYYVLIKYIYLHQPFVGAFVWSRLGSFIACLVILLIPVWRKSIREGHSNSQFSGISWLRKIHPQSYKQFLVLLFFFFVRLLAALAFIMLNWAISKGNVALINSLQGVQYLFLFLLVLFISGKYPKVFEEELGGGVLVQKIIGVILVSIGLYVLMG